jgi:hypothetical protein
MNSWSWRARIETPAGEVLGAGLLVDPSRLLTCAHVVAGLARVQVTFPGVADGLAASVEVCGDWRRTGDEGDLAVLTLDREVGIAPARFATDPAGRWAHGRLGALGFPAGSADIGKVAQLGTGPDRQVREWWQVDVVDPHLQPLKKGFSGSGVYLIDTGEVVGIATDTDRALRGMSGLMLPLRSIRKYWEEIDDLIDLGWLTAPARRRLRAIVADAECDVPLEALFRHVFPGFQGKPSFTSIWDAIRFVAEESLAPDPLRPFLTGLSARLEQPARELLVGWIRQWLPAAGPREAAKPTSVIVRLDRMTRGDVYELSLFTLVDGVSGPATRPVQVGEDEIRNAVEAALPAVLGAVVGHDWIIEFASPVALFNQPYENWYIDREDGIRMRAYPVVVRDVHRMNPGSVRRDLALKRWRLMRERGTAAFAPVYCRLEHTDEEFQDWLDAEEDCSVLAYAGTPSPGLLNASLNAGIPVILWPRSLCRASAHDDCWGVRTLAALKTALAGTHPDELPKAVMLLRKNARRKQAGSDHCGRDLALVWDDPARMPDPPLYTGA